MQGSQLRKWTVKLGHTGAVLTYSREWCHHLIFAKSIVAFRWNCPYTNGKVECVSSFDRHHCLRRPRHHHHGGVSFLLHTVAPPHRLVINPRHSYKLCCWRYFPNPQINLTLCQMSYGLVSIRAHIAGRLKRFGGVIRKHHRCPDRR